ncbi:MAG: hypothetical protein MK193_10955 [Lentisphaeria bacterium]|nr:hypothetical protein [Lentisphaeria bacterium]
MSKKAKHRFPPSRKQLAGKGDFLCNDTEWMLNNFLGKTNKDIVEMLNLGELLSEDFTYMKPAGLSYYLDGAFAYLKSTNSKGDSDFSSGLVCSLYCQIFISKINNEKLY